MDSEALQMFGCLAAITAVIALYFVPFIIGIVRRHPNLGPILIVTVLLGWTGIGWVVALAMACSAIREVRS